MHTYPGDIDDNISSSTTVHSRATHQIISISSTITHLPTISCPHHHLPRPLIKSSAYPVQLPTCQQSHAPTTTLTPTHPDCHPPAPPQPTPTATHPDCHPPAPPPPTTQKLSNAASPAMKVSVAVFRANLAQSHCVWSPGV